MHKYDAQVMKLFTECFNLLPLAACIEKKILVVHGGLCSEDHVTLEGIRKINRRREPPIEGPMCDLLWADPQVIYLISFLSSHRSSLGEMSGAYSRP